MGNTIGTPGYPVLHCGIRPPDPPEDPTALRLIVELVYDPGCPNVDKARAVLTRALQEADVPAVWTEWGTDDPDCPANRKAFGSPTILVNGEDVAPGPHPWAPREPDEGPRVRVYRDGDSIVPIPPQRRITRAISEALGPSAG